MKRIVKKQAKKHLTRSRRKAVVNKIAKQFGCKRSVANRFVKLENRPIAARTSAFPESVIFTTVKSDGRFLTLSREKHRPQHFSGAYSGTFPCGENMLPSENGTLEPGWSV